VNPGIKAIKGSEYLKREGAAAVAADIFRNSDPLIPFLTECDVCGSRDLAEIKCKVICRNCRTILQSCADL
jgi:hypothetical protein